MVEYRTAVFFFGCGIVSFHLMVLTYAWSQRHPQLLTNLGITFLMLTSLYLILTHAHYVATKFKIDEVRARVALRRRARRAGSPNRAAPTGRGRCPRRAGAHRRLLPVAGGVHAGRRHQLREKPVTQKVAPAECPRVATQPTVAMKPLPPYFHGCRDPPP